MNSCYPHSDLSCICESLAMIVVFPIAVFAMRLLIASATVVYSILSMTINAISLAIRLATLYSSVVNDIRLATLFAIAVVIIHLRDAMRKDLISQLPDDILISILERVSIKTAVRTSVLSKRWMNLHRLVSNIDLNCSHLLGPYYCPEKHNGPQASNFMITSLDRFLRIRSGSNSKIHSLCLTCYLKMEVTERFEQCVYLLGRVGVEELTLNCCCECDMNWKPQEFYFSCQLISEMPLLKDFKLSFCYLQPSLNFQSNSSLQFLCLSYVKLCTGAIECVLSNCLRLRSLTIIRCECPSKLSLCGHPHLKLKSLYMSACEDLEEIELYADNLVIFEFFSRHAVNFKFNHVPKLENIYLGSYEKNIVPYVCGKLAKDLPHLKALNFTCPGEIQFFNIMGSSSRQMRINKFYNLRRLDVSICSQKYFNLFLLTPFLQSCPLLQSFQLNINTVEHDGPVEKKQGVVFHSELKKMEISGFCGTESEIEFALYIIRSAISLEKMYISRWLKLYDISKWIRYYATPWSEETKRTIQRRLQGEAVSKAAQVVIQHEAI